MVYGSIRTICVMFKMFNVNIHSNDWVESTMAEDCKIGSRVDDE